jgi:hypothetical protein
LFYFFLFSFLYYLFSPSRVDRVDHRVGDSGISGARRPFAAPMQ